MSGEGEIKRNLIGGRWVLGTGAVPNINPSDLTDIVGTYAQGSSEDVNAAVEAASKAARAWWLVGSQARADFLDRVGTQLLARREEIGRLLAREEGKTLAEGMAEVNRAGQVFKFFSGEAVRQYGTAVASVRPGVDVEVRREPVGVVGLITPWNFPIAIPAWKIAPALAYGNTVVIKPPELTPACVHLLAEILLECRCPDGVFNLVMGKGRTVGQALVDHPGLSALSFTGSVDVGRGIIASAGARQLKVQAEMGGKNATVVLADANLDIAIPAIVNAAFGSTGQRCTATSRIVVQRSILEKFTERFVCEATTLRVGHALDPSTQMGPVVSDAQLQGNLRYVRLAREEGAEVLGGEVVEQSTRGYFQRPAVFLNAMNQMQVSREEIFGPCVSIIVAEDFDDAIRLVNDTPYGLSAGICTTNLTYAREFVRQARSGLVMVNLPTAGVDYHVAFGGTKGSSYGPREQGREAIEFYTTVKTAYTLA
jgi:acyl-CoA reductase-like NAD-dependent aldehyde dehydrogenase